MNLGGNRKKFKHPLEKSTYEAGPREIEEGVTIKN